MDASNPVQADHRFISKVLSMIAPGKVEYRGAEFDRVSRVFVRAGGSWERLYKGSSEDVALLKKLLKVAVKHGYLTKKDRV